MKVSIPKLSTPGKIDIARAALANDLPALSKLVAAIPGNPSAANTTKYYATRFAWSTDKLASHDKRNGRKRLFVG